MKRKLLLILFIVISVKSIGQVNVGFPKTSETDQWNGTSWINQSKITYAFNSDCLPIQILSQFNNAGTLVNSFLITITYNSSNQQIQLIYQIWDSDTTTWINQQKTENTYDGENLSQTTTSFWVANAWQLNFRSIYTYNSSGLLSNLINQNWDNSGSSWINSSKSEFIYDSNDRLTTTTYFNWNAVTMVWDNSSKSEFIYDSNDRIITTTNFNWNATTMVWDNDTRRTNVYLNSSNLVSSTTTDTWNNNQWVNDSLETYTYDASNYLIKYLLAKWESTSMSYLNDSQFLYTNNSDGYPTTVITQSWNSSTSSWSNTARIRNTYSSCSALSVKDFENVDVKIFPNPVIENTFINTPTKAIYILSNIKGQLLIKGTLKQGTNTINLSHLSNGLYFINIVIDNKSVIKKIIKQ